MMTELRNHFLRFALAVLAPACTIGEGDDAECQGGKCDGGADQSCSDPRYGDGTCQPELSCAVPDIDCFTTFETDEQAATWFEAVEARLATSQGRAARPIMSSTDPRFGKVRAFLDRGWEAFREHRPVGELGSVRPALVLLDDPTANAFVVPDDASGKSALAVIVQTGAADGLTSEDATLGLMMHELQHAVGLHLIADVRVKMRRFYVAPDGEEPIGRFATEHARARDAGAAWRTLADEVGYHVNAELGGLPISGAFNQVLIAVVSRGLQNDPAGCAHSAQLVNAILTGLAPDPISGALGADLATLRGRVDTALAALRDECLPGVTITFAQVVAALAGTSPEVIEMQMSAEDKALIANKHIVDAIAALTLDRRAKMRAIEAKFEEDVGRPWSALRYFSFEEDADDVSVPVLRAMGLEPTGMGAFLHSALGVEAQARCAQILARGEVPPYGVDVQDEHHATCWRVHHIRAFADDTAKSRPRELAPAPTPVPEPRRLLPPRPEDLIVY